MDWWYYVIVFGVAALLGIPLFFFARTVDKRRARREAKVTEEERDKRRARNERYEVINAYLWLGALIVWLAISFLGELFPGPESGGRATAAAEEAVGSLLSVVLGPDDPNNFRIQHRSVGNVRVFIPKAAWERIPFPDRDGVRKIIGKAWCDSRKSLFLHVVSIRDIRTGDELERYHCDFLPWHRP